MVLFWFSRITTVDILRNAAKTKNSKSGTLPGKFLKGAIHVVAPHLLPFSIGPFKKDLFLTILRLLVFVQSLRARALNLILIIIDQSQYCRWWQDYMKDLCMTNYWNILKGSCMRPKHSTETLLLNTTNQLCLNPILDGGGKFAPPSRFF